MSGKRNRESDLSSDDESGVEEIAEFSNKRTRKNTSSFKGASFLREPLTTMKELEGSTTTVRLEE